MNKVLNAIKSISENDYAVVENGLIGEISIILNGLGVRFQIVKIDENTSSLVIA